MRSSFILNSTAHGPMIMPLNDWKPLDDGKIEPGVGVMLLQEGVYDQDGLQLMSAILEHRRRNHGDGVVMIDGGANIGAYAVSLGRVMESWGKVLCFEPQERIFYALCGNIALNNCMNVSAYRAALGRKDAMMEFPVPDYTKPGNYGGVNALGQADIGQKIELRQSVPSKQIDSLKLQRLDFLKLDVEGMEIEALTGAEETITRCHPFIMAEHIKVGSAILEKFFHNIGYQTAMAGIDLVAAFGKNEIVEQLKSVKDAA